MALEGSRFKPLLASQVNRTFFEHRSLEHEVGSLEAVVSKLIKNWAASPKWKGGTPKLLGGLTVDMSEMGLAPFGLTCSTNCKAACVPNWPDTGVALRILGLMVAQTEDKVNKEHATQLRFLGKVMDPSLCSTNDSCSALAKPNNSDDKSDSWQVK